MNGKSILLNESYKLVSITEQENDIIKEILKRDANNEDYSELSEKIGIHLADEIVAHGKGNPSEKTIKKIIRVHSIHGERKVFPCYCNHNIDPNQRVKDGLYPILHEDAESSFICARERLFYPDYCVILKLNGNGKEVKKIDEDTDNKI